MRNQKFSDREVRGKLWALKHITCPSTISRLSLQANFSRQIFFAERITSLLSHLFQYFSLHLFCSYSVQNWSSEFRKWLGNERLKVYTVNSDKRVKVKKRTHAGRGKGYRYAHLLFLSWYWVERKFCYRTESCKQNKMLYLWATEDTVVSRARP